MYKKTMCTLILLLSLATGNFYATERETLLEKPKQDAVAQTQEIVKPKKLSKKNYKIRQKKLGFIKKAGKATILSIGMVGVATITVLTGIGIFAGIGSAIGTLLFCTMA